MFATLADLAAWYGWTPEELTAKFPTAARTLEAAENRLLAYIFPCVVCSETQKDALVTAACAQFAHEHNSDAAQLMMSAPAGLQSFTIGHWSAAFARGATAESLFPAGLDNSAYAILLRSGLLFRGVTVCS